MIQKAVASSLGLSLFLMVLIGTIPRYVSASDLWSGIKGRGTATIDGRMGRREWTAAGQHDFLVTTPGGFSRGTLFVMNDNTNLYVAVRFDRSIVDPGNSLSFTFDSNRNGLNDTGDDAIILNPSSGFFDMVKTNGTTVKDTDVRGANDGAGAFGNNGRFTVYEMSHPLNSGDPNDFSIGPGTQKQRIEFFLSLRIIGQGNIIVDTDFPPFRVFLARIAVSPRPQPLR